QPTTPSRPRGYDDEIARLTAGGRPLAFTRTRATIKSQLHISNAFTDRNSAQARMLRAVDSYHATTNLADKLGYLETVRAEADHWLVKHPDWLLGKSTTTRNRFKLIRDEAAAVLQTYRDQDDAAYLADLQSERMFASSEHVKQAMDVLQNARGENPYGAGAIASRYGLTLAELAAIKVYCGPAYKFINPALEDDRSVMNSRLLGFVREIKLAKNNNKSAKTRIRDAEAARLKLAQSDDPISAAMAEGQRHAAFAVRGLAKLPPFTGRVFAGGALTRGEAMQRFRTGDVQLRKSFASTSSEEYVAAGFAEDKDTKLKQAYDSVPVHERNTRNASFPFMLRYTSKTGRDIADLSVDPSEHEILFAPGSKLRITKGADSPTAETKVFDGEIDYTYIDAVEV
ncbi:MAG: hypothetical protein KC431_27015, partial [Myxococcales bacterium]|nr:hypothetical protein [Myxococcales bacterium]